MPIRTLHIGALTPSQLAQLTAISQEVYDLTGEHFSMLDPELINKLGSRLTQFEAHKELDSLNQLAPLLGESLGENAA